MVDQTYLSGETISLDRQNFAESWNFHLPIGKWTSLIGASGAGKSTLLDIIAGFLPLKSGRLKMADNDITTIPVAKRKMAYLFQESSLFPSLDVCHNLLLAMHDSHFTKAEKLSQINSVLSDLELQSKINVYPKTLSGGEKARVELARSILRGCDVLLLDEPFAALDPRLRRQMLILLRRLQKKFSLTVVCVSHNPEDSYLVADHVVAMHKGQILVSKSLSETMVNPQYPEVVDLLQLGFTSQQQDGLWFVPHHALRTSSDQCDADNNEQKFGLKPSGESKAPAVDQHNMVQKKQRMILLRDFVIIKTPSGPGLLDLETGILYPKRDDAIELGKFFFNEDRCLKLSST